jgi:putative hydrolase of HD superfamily
LEGYTWKKHNITYDMIIEKNKKIKDSSEKIWEFVLKVLDDAVERGYLEN